MADLGGDPHYGMAYYVSDSKKKITTYCPGKISTKPWLEPLAFNFQIL